MDRGLQSKLSLSQNISLPNTHQLQRVKWWSYSEETWQTDTNMTRSLRFNFTSGWTGLHCVFPDKMHWEEHNAIYVEFLPGKHDLSLVMRKHWIEIQAEGHITECQVCILSSYQEHEWGKTVPGTDISDVTTKCNCVSGWGPGPQRKKSHCWDSWWKFK